MAKAIPYDYRVKIVKRMKQGEKASDLSEEMGYSESGIKKIWRLYKEKGEQAYYNNYSNCGHAKSYDMAIRQAAEQVRDNMQGGNYVHSKLRQKYPLQRIPSSRTLQRWWVKQGTNRKKGRPAEYEKKVESSSS